MREDGVNMTEFVLKNHVVGEAFFVENSEKEKKNSIEIGVEGGILIPQEEEGERKAVVKLTFHMGKEDERLYLRLNTISVFEIIGQHEMSLSEEEVHKKCLPIALAQLRKTVKMVMEAYGRPGIDLPPFAEESIEG